MLEIKVYNTLTRKKEVFVPVRAGQMGMYSCGPTVYKPAHIGNLRAYVYGRGTSRFRRRRRRRQDEQVRARNGQRPPSNRGGNYRPFYGGYRRAQYKASHNMPQGYG